MRILELQQARKFWASSTGFSKRERVLFLCSTGSTWAYGLGPRPVPAPQEKTGTGLKV